MKDFLIRFGITFSVAFITNAIFVYLWNLIRHGEGALEWEKAFFFAITLGIVLPLVLGWRSKEQ